jgi:uncharacterized protein (TIGR00369 family)
LAPPDGFAPIIHSNPFGAHIGPIYERLEGEDFCRGFFIAEKLTNSVGIAHGGVLMTFADIVLARAVMAEIDAAAVTIRLTCDFIAPAKERRAIRDRIVKSWSAGHEFDAETFHKLRAGRKDPPVKLGE